MTTTETETSVGAFVVGFVFAFLAAAAVTLYEAWVIATLWRWFAVPIGAPAIGVLGAAGVGLLVTVITNRIPRGEATKKQQAEYLFIPVYCLCIGQVLMWVR